MTVFFTADQHWHHNNIIKYCNRPFSSTEEMDEVMIERWNQVVHKNDTVYFLGDLTLGGIEDANNILGRINGYIHMIEGNHDKRWYGKINYGNEIKQLPPIHVLKGFEKPIVLSHYPMRAWDGSYHGSWHLYGHEHGNLPDYNLSFDIGVDCWDFYPVSIDEVVDKMRLLSIK